MAKQRRSAATDGFGDVDHPAFPTNGQRVRFFIEKYCTHAKGEWFGQPLILERWQQWLLNEMFRVDPVTGRRVWRQVLLMLPRKNAKSTLIAALGFYFLVFDDEGGPEVFSAAWGEQQARNVFDAARTMHDASPLLQAQTQKFAKAITCPGNAGTWRVVSRLAETQQGTNPHAALIDELHVHQRLDLYDAFKRGTQARRQPMLLAITTEGTDTNSPLGELQTGYLNTGCVENVTPYLQMVRDEATASLMVRWGVPWGSGEVDPENIEVIRGCNPAGWLDANRLVAEYLKAPGSREVDFRRYHLNQLVEGDDAGVTAAEWDACCVPDARLADGTQAYSASDLGFTGDWSAHAVAGVTDDDRVCVSGMAWQPPSDKARELSIRATVDTYARAEAQRLRMQMMLCDEWNARLLMQDWQGEGLPAGVFSQRMSFMCPASQAFMEAIKEKRLVHNGDPVLRAHVLSMRRKDTGGGSWKFIKHTRNDDPSGDYKTDLGFCAVAAVFQAMGAAPNHLESHGLYI